MILISSVTHSLTEFSPETVLLLLVCCCRLLEVENLAATRVQADMLANPAAGRHPEDASRGVRCSGLELIGILRRLTRSRNLGGCGVGEREAGGYGGDPVCGRGG